MEDLSECEVMDFGIVNPGRTYKKELKTASNVLVKEVVPSPYVHPLENVFTVVRDPKSEFTLENRFVVKFQPVLPHRKSFSYLTLHVEGGTSSMVYLEGQTKGPDIRLSTSKIYFCTSSLAPTSVYKLKMVNRSDCADSFCWDYIPEKSDVEIVPYNGVIPADSRLQITVLFKPRKIGLFYRSFACLFRYQDPLFIDIYGFHGKTPLKLNLERYIHLEHPQPFFPNGAFRYMSDTREHPGSNPIITQSRRYIDFGKVNTKKGPNIVVEGLSLVNHSLHDLTAVWDESSDPVFYIQPPKAVIPQGGGSVAFDISFCPTLPDLFYSAEIHASFQWGLRNEFTAPVSVKVYLVGDSFSREGCGWPPTYAIERTRIILPATIPDFPVFIPFSIWKVGPLPMHFKLEPVSKNGRFAVKPSEGVIKSDFQVVVVMFCPGNKVDVIYKEDWLLVINRLLKVKLEFCGSSELPFLLAGDGKNVTIPPITVGCWSTIDVPVKNPTRLELEYNWASYTNIGEYIPKEINPIGAGETVVSSLHFHFNQLGPFTRSRAISFRWAPSDPGTVKSLARRNVTSETVLRLLGLVESPKLCAEKDTLSMKSVFLNDEASEKILLSNNGSSTVHVKLGCFPSKWSTLGYWEFFPNPFSLGPNKTLEVKLNMIGQCVGYQLFTVKYVMLDSSTFSKETSDWLDLCQGDINVYFPSLSVVDIRYDGLAKSLSKHSLWSLLQINSLNDHLSDLVDGKDRAVHMKFPKYHTNTPPLSVEILLKNTCEIPLRLEVAVSKNCFCPPHRKDTISKRLMDYSCDHDDQVEAELRESKILPEKTATLAITLNYDLPERASECPYTVVLTVSPHDGKMRKHKRLLRLVVDRGIIRRLSSNMNLLLPGEYGTKIFNFKFEDVYVGDPSTYYQVLWLYNHSQNDIRYWVEWLYVNKKIFRILNDRGKVDAYSSHPLLISFTPFEMKSYWAQLAVVNEIGEEFHINFTGQGSVNPLVRCPHPTTTTIRMLNKMPPTSQFEDPHAELEISVDHLALRPLPTHSFDKYVLFMRNTSKSVLSFRWEIKEIWSILHVMVVPSQGEIQPGEIFPIQIHVKTLRFCAILDFSIECLYYDKTKSVQYWEKCHYLEKATKVFDTCFVFVPDDEIEIAYENPKTGMTAGESPKNKIAAIGASIHIFDREHMDLLLPRLSDQLRYVPPPKLQLKPAKYLAKKIHGRQPIGATDVLKTVIRTVVESTAFKEMIKRKQPEVRYIDIPDGCSRQRLRSKQHARLPGKFLSMLLANVLYGALVNLFGFDACVYHEIMYSVSGKVEQDVMFKMYNEYYERILRTAVDQACAPPENVRIKRTYSRDQLAIVRRMSM